MAPKEIPERWLPYRPIGTPVPGTRFIPLKVPLKEPVCAKLPPNQRWTIDILLSNHTDIGMIIDLTLTTRYYNFVDILNRGVDYCKIALPGQVLPSEDLVKRFFSAVDFYLEHHPDGSLIGVHCTHGVNRTGYMIARYMIQRLGFSLSEAIEGISSARGYPIEREKYINDLGRHLQRAPKILDGSDVRQGRSGTEPPRMPMGAKGDKKPKPPTKRVAAKVFAETGKGTVKRHGPARGGKQDGNIAPWKKSRRDLGPWNPGFEPNEFNQPSNQDFVDPLGEEIGDSEIYPGPKRHWGNKRGFNDGPRKFEDRGFHEEVFDGPSDHFVLEGRPPKFDGRAPRGRGRAPFRRFGGNRRHEGDWETFENEGDQGFDQNEGSSDGVIHKDNRGFGPRGPKGPQWSNEGRGHPRGQIEEPWEDGPPQGPMNDRRGFRGRRNSPGRRGPPLQHRQMSPTGRMSPGRRGSPPPNRRMSPPGRQMSPPGHRMSPGRGSPPLGRGMSPPRHRMSPPPGRRMSPGWRGPSPQGRRMSPPSRPMGPPPGRRMSPQQKRPMGPLPGRRMTPPPQERRLSPMSDHGIAPQPFGTKGLQPFGMFPPPQQRMSPPRQRRMSPPRMSPPRQRRMSPPRVSPPRQRRMSPPRMSPPRQRRMSPPSHHRMSPPMQQRMSPPRQRRMSPPGQRRMSPLGHRRMSPPHTRRMSPPHQLGERVPSPSRRRGSPALKRVASLGRGRDINEPFQDQQDRYERPRPDNELYSVPQRPPNSRPPIESFGERGRPSSPGSGRMRRSRSPMRKRGSPSFEMSSSKRRGSPPLGRMEPPSFNPDNRRPRPNDVPSFDGNDFELVKDIRPGGPRSFDRGDFQPFDNAPQGRGKPRMNDRSPPHSQRSPPRFSNRRASSPNQQRDRRDFDAPRRSNDNFPGPPINERKDLFNKPGSFPPQRRASPPHFRGHQSPEKLFADMRKPPPPLPTRHPPIEDFPPKRLGADSFATNEKARNPYRSPGNSPVRRGPSEIARGRPRSNDRNRGQRPRSAGRSRSPYIVHEDRHNRRSDLSPQRMGREERNKRFNDVPTRGAPGRNEGSRYPNVARAPSGPFINTIEPQIVENYGSQSSSRSVSPVRPRATSRLGSPKRYSEDFPPTFTNRPESPGFPEINDKCWDAEPDCRELLLQKRITSITSRLDPTGKTQFVDPPAEVIVIDDSSDPEHSRPSSSQSRRRPPVASRLSPKLPRRGRSRSPSSKKPIFDRLEEKKPPIFERLNKGPPSRRSPPPRDSPNLSSRKPRGGPRGRH